MSKGPKGSLGADGTGDVVLDVKDTLLAPVPEVNFLPNALEDASLFLLLGCSACIKTGYCYQFVAPSDALSVHSIL